MTDPLEHAAGKGTEDDTPRRVARVADLVKAKRVTEDQIREVFTELTVDQQRMSLKDLAFTYGELLQRFGKSPSVDITVFHADVSANEDLLSILSAAMQQPGLLHTDYATLEMTAQWHRGLRWAYQGFNVFSLSHGLVAGLMLTESPPHDEHLKKEDLHLPFETFALRIPSETIPFWLSPDEQVWADTIWVHYYEIGDSTCIYWGAAYKSIVCWRKYPLTHVLEEMPGYMHGQRMFEIDPPSVEQDILTVTSAWHLVRNFCLWLSATGGMQGREPEAVVKKKKKRKPSKRDIQRKMGFWPTTWNIGREVKVDKVLRDTIPAMVLGQKRSKQERKEWELKCQFVVRGHMRNQVCGSGRLQRKMIWIQPYWKGPKDAEAWSHLYKNESDF